MKENPLERFLGEARKGEKEKTKKGELSSEDYRELERRSQFWRENLAEMEEQGLVSVKMEYDERKNPKSVEVRSTDTGEVLYFEDFEAEEKAAKDTLPTYLKSRE